MNILESIEHLFILSIIFPILFLYAFVAGKKLVQTRAVWHTPHAVLLFKDKRSQVASSKHPST